MLPDPIERLEAQIENVMYAHAYDEASDTIHGYPWRLGSGFGECLQLGKVLGVCA